MSKSALAVDLLMSSGKKREKAARQVAKKLREYGVPIGGKSDVQEWKTILGWREKLAKAGNRPGQGNPDFAFHASFYLLQRDALLQMVMEENISPETVANWQLEAVRLTRVG